MLRGAGQAWAPCRAVSSGSGSTLYLYFRFSYGACAVSHRGTRLIAIEGLLFTLTREAHERAGRRKPRVERASPTARLGSDSTTYLIPRRDPRLLLPSPSHLSPSVKQERRLMYPLG